MVWVLRARACQAAWCADRLGSADSPVTVDQKMAGVGDGRQVQLLRLDDQIGGGREPVELQREMVGRVVLAERQRGEQARHLGHEGVQDPEPDQFLVHELTEAVRPGPGDHRSAVTVPGCGDRDIGRAAAQRLGERLHVLQATLSCRG